MTGDSAASVPRLLHALERLHGEPRSDERRSDDRRCMLLPWPASDERRREHDRRMVERRSRR